MDFEARKNYAFIASKKRREKRFRGYASMATKRKAVSKRNESSDVLLGNSATPANILYDLNIFTEWSQDVENAVSSNVVYSFNNFSNAL
ncbi:NBAS [Bugula neritina]|uniref:NBAS n=1 Tax=Bugula neritina TaxID=10212 RepID=A0A7J7KQZ4_BUGNE|nr:NBAS [Bugula neritina]